MPTGSDLALGLAVGLFVAIAAHLLILAWRLVRGVNATLRRINGE
jgi:hypothetical protein